MKKYIVLTLPVGLLAGVAISQVIPRKVNKGEVFEVVDQSGEVIWEAPTRSTEHELMRMRRIKTCSECLMT